MSRFEIDKKGYEVTQVDKFIDALTLKYEEKLSEQKDRVFSLKKENSLLQERLENYELKDKQISKALIMAVEKAEQIETSARKIYDLEVRRIRLIYNKWDELLKQLEENYPEFLTNGKIQLAINEFNSNITSVIKQNEKFEQNTIKEDIKKNSDNYIKNLLNKMDYIINDNKINKSPSKIDVIEKKLASTSQKTSTRLQNIQKRFNNLGKTFGNKTFEDEMNNNIETDNAYAKNITNITDNSTSDEFNMEDILNPKEELDEIMKAFDFYASNPDEK